MTFRVVPVNDFVLPLPPASILISRIERPGQAQALRGL